MLRGILKEVRSWLEPMASAISGSKRNMRKGFPWLQSVMLTEHVADLLHELHGFFAHRVVVQGQGTFAFGDQPKEIPETRRLVCCVEWRIFNELDQTLARNTHLEQFVHPHPCGGQYIQGQESQQRGGIERLHWDQHPLCFLLCSTEKEPIAAAPIVGPICPTQQTRCVAHKGGGGCIIALFSISP